MLTIWSHPAHYLVYIDPSKKAWYEWSQSCDAFLSMSISPPVPEIWLSQNLTLKIQGQGHGCGQLLRSQTSIQSIHFLFFTHISEIRLFQIQGQGHGWGQRARSHSWPWIQLMQLLFASCHQPFLRYHLYAWPQKHIRNLEKKKLQKVKTNFSIPKIHTIVFDHKNTSTILKKKSCKKWKLIFSTELLPNLSRWEAWPSENVKKKRKLYHHNHLIKDG